MIISSPSAAASPQASPTLSPAVTKEFKESMVRLNGRPLFKIQSDSGIKASERARLIEDRISELLEGAAKPPSVDIVIVEGTPAIKSGGTYLISVTNSDAEANGTSVFTLASQWRDLIEHGMKMEWSDRRLKSAKQAWIQSGIAIIAGLILSIIGLTLFSRYFKIPGSILLIFIWLCVIFFIVSKFPETGALGKNIIDMFLRPIIILILIVICILMASKFLDEFVAHIMQDTFKLRALDTKKNLRAINRLETIRRTSSIIIRAILVVIGAIFFLNSMRVNIGSALTGAGFLSVGVGIAAQDLLKDYVAGFLFVIEDQFAVNDFIKIGDISGEVEEFNLRATKIRDIEGHLITIPNSNIRIVENMSSGWNQVDLRFTIPHDVDAIKAMNLIADTAKKLKEEWKEKIIGEPEMLGIEELTDSGTKIRMLLKTLPLQQSKVKRELLLRIKSCFKLEGISAAFPQRGIWINSKISENSIKPENKDSTLNKENPSVMVKDSEQPLLK